MSLFFAFDAKLKDGVVEEAVTDLINQKQNMGELEPGHQQSLLMRSSLFKKIGKKKCIMWDDLEVLGKVVG